MNFSTNIIQKYKIPSHYNQIEKIKIPTIFAHKNISHFLKTPIKMAHHNKGSHRVKRMSKNRYSSIKQEVHIMPIQNYLSNQIFIGSFHPSIMSDPFIFVSLSVAFQLIQLNAA